MGENLELLVQIDNGNREWNNCTSYTKVIGNSLTEIRPEGQDKIRSERLKLRIISDERRIEIKSELPQRLPKNCKVSAVLIVITDPRH